jgi:glycosyltransferase involved in cell wall biosynthesis
MRIAFFSTMGGMPWGGSEELWSQAAAILLERGHQVCVNYKRRRQLVPPLEKLRQLGAEVYWRRGPFFGRSIRRVMEKLHLGQQPYMRWLKHARPDYVLISVGFHLDDVAITQTCRLLGIPYGLLVQAASPYHFVEPRYYEGLRAAYGGAARCYFVSGQNRDVLESNLALDLSDSEIVDNPFNVRADAAPAWPASDKLWKLACVARVHFTSKAQDLLVDVLRRPKWRARPLEVSLWGADGGSLRQMQALIELHGLQKQLVVSGFSNDVESLWSQHHGLILPSRFEGNALAMIEAMMCGRMAVVTNVGRVAELVDDNRTGFIAPAPTAELIDEAMERAWQLRHEWKSMGALAAQTIRQRHSQNPPADFAEALLAAPRRSTFRAAA